MRSAIDASSPRARVAGASTAATALASTLSTPVPLAAGLTVALLVAAALVDVIDRRLPNRMVGAALLGGTAATLATMLLGGHLDLRGAALGTVAFAGPLLAMHLVAPASMGFGDVKVACVLGAAVGLIHPVYGLVALTAGSLLAAVGGFVTRRRTVAFGPPLVAGAVVALLLSAASASPTQLFHVPPDRPSVDVGS